MIQDTLEIGSKVCHNRYGIGEFRGFIKDRSGLTGYCKVSYDSSESSIPYIIHPSNLKEV